ncbi:hypothetical protein Taro_047089 [Colocasia esculenta]|uniref:RNase H type-1 domain-containing protein n=1 Tax=Colocasia esculenta TaxID=4460 RepID=A0A843WVB8_COLES|nr:hypothetical protein [Colocasia esculenta]
MASSIISGSLGGYSAEFLSTEQQERFTFVKTKLCGNKAVDVADLEKNGMISVVAAMRRMQWMGITTFSEVSYPDLVKAFYVCLRTEADGSLISSVKGTQIKIDHEVLKTLFDEDLVGSQGVVFPFVVKEDLVGIQGVVGLDVGLLRIGGRLKLNVDGAFKLATGGAGGGGILRDHEGRYVIDFAKNYQGVISALDAEARALWDGLTICCNKGFLDIMVETDSLNLKQIVTGQMHRPWELTCIIQEVAVITKKLKAQIMHVPREANQVAHSLAGYGCSTELFSCWESGAEIPHVFKGPYHLDKVGCPTHRL